MGASRFHTTRPRHFVDASIIREPGAIRPIIVHGCNGAQWSLHDVSAEWNLKPLASSILSTSAPGQRVAQNKFVDIGRHTKKQDAHERQRTENGR